MLRSRERERFAFGPYGFGHLLLSPYKTPGSKSTHILCQLQLGNLGIAKPSPKPIAFAYA